MKDTFLTLKQISEGLYKEKGSKFLSFAYPVENEFEIKKILDNLKNQFYDARHHCYAYVLRQDKSNFRANDDGEPNHSAGDPILGQIRSHELTNVLIVVVRYFGGTKLGVGGLIQAYKTAASEAILNNEIITAIVREKISLRFNYVNMNEVMKMIKEDDLEIIEQYFDNSCEIHLWVRKKLLPEILNKIEAMEEVRLITD